jgi:hypothetical protein
MAILADRYLQLELSLEDTITALSEQVARLESEGRATYWAIQRLETYQRYQLRLLAELDTYNAWASENIHEGQLTFAGLGYDHAAATLETARRGASVPLADYERERILSMVSYAGDGSPLSTLLAQSGDYVRATVTQKLIEAVGKAQNPRITAREIRKATGMALNRAMAIARTEQMRVYRDATLTGYRAAGVQLFQRISGRQSTSCIACISLDGEISSTEAELDDHCNGFCTSLPLLQGAENPQMEPAQQWFSRQPETLQRSIMGTERYRLYKDGQISWSELGRHTHDSVWGGSVSPVPLRDLNVSAAA